MTSTRKKRWFILLSLMLLAGASALAIEAVNRWRLTPESSDGIFEIKPYLQLGNNPTLQPDGTDRLDLVWQTLDHEDAWAVFVKHGDAWIKSEPIFRRVNVEGLAPFRLYKVSLKDLNPGEAFDYKIERNGKLIFDANALPRKLPGLPSRFVVFGDCGAGTWEERAIAYRTSLEKPDYVMITGDIVYMRGRVSEYLANFFPVYNSDTASTTKGAPLMRSILFVAAPGNHDLVEGDFTRIPDAFAYFYYWDVPQNGPLAAPRVPGAPLLKGDESRQRDFLDVAPHFPRSANYAFDIGDVHWTVLDSNPHADWANPTLLAWLEADLKASQAKPWRFVSFHHPGFSSSHAHADDQRMRFLSPIFEAGKVQIVFSGHVHNYQRTLPLKFVPKPEKSGASYGPGGRVDGEWTLDTKYDGKSQTRPDGVIYLVTGSGGARLYDPDQQDDTASMKPFTQKFISKIHSLTVVDVTPEATTIRQVSAEGEEIDRFKVTQ